MKKIYISLIPIVLMTVHNAHLFGDPINAQLAIDMPVLLTKLAAHENIIFTKFGDGEYYCVIGESGVNCDGDHYHQWKGEALKKSVIGLSRKKNCYIGKWHVAHVPQYFDAFAKQHGVTIPWVDYHLILNHDGFNANDHMYNFVKFIRDTPRKKILVCNPRNNRLVEFFKIDVLVNIPGADWSFQYETYRAQVEKHAQNDCIILIAGGMCSKVLINDLTDKYDLTFIDIGSGFDLLATKTKSRAWQHTFEDELLYYRDFIPASWN